MAAARVVFAREGLAASMASIAREAGVGKATISRHFPTLEPLIDAVFGDRMALYADAARDALATPDPWRSFADFVWAIAALQASDRGFADLMITSTASHGRLAEQRLMAYQGFLEIIDRGKNAGVVREDFVPQDLVVLLMANAGVLSATGDDAPDGWRRLVGQLLRAFAAPGTDAAEVSSLPPSPASPELIRAMERRARP